MQLGKLTLSPKLHEILIRECFDVIGAIQYVHKKLGPALPEYVYQEALYRRLQTYGYLNGTGFPLAILVNFGTYPKAQVLRYYHEGDDIVAF